MKTVSITHPKRKPGAVQAVVPSQAVAPRLEGGTLRVLAQATFDPQRAREAAAKIRQLGLKYKPSKKHGATAAVRDLRNRGE